MKAVYTFDIFKIVMEIERLVRLSRKKGLKIDRHYDEVVRRELISS